MSTGTVYAQTREPARESDPIPVGAPRSFYAASKLAAELLLGPYSASFGVVQLRLFMPYGPGQNERMLLPVIAGKVRDGIPIDLHGPNGLTCNPTAIGDVAEAVRRCLSVDGSHILNLAGPDVLTLRQVAEAIGSVIGRRPRFQTNPNDPPVVVGDTTRLKAALGWQPPTRFAEGVHEWLGPK
jgi:nucleoside-diphosphate-sugar epimerase